MPVCRAFQRPIIRADVMRGTHSQRHAQPRPSQAAGAGSTSRCIKAGRGPRRCSCNPSCRPGGSRLQRALGASRGWISKTNSLPFRADTQARAEPGRPRSSGFPVTPWLRVPPGRHGARRAPCPARLPAGSPASTRWRPLRRRAPGRCQGAGRRRSRRAPSCPGAAR
jgi:hypothetical protein